MELVKTEEQIDELAPNTTATLFALKNLDSNKWKDRRGIEVSTADYDENQETLLEKIKEASNE